MARSKRSGRWLLLLSAVGIGVVAWLFVLPGYVRRQAIAEAREAGVTLTIERVRLGWSGIRFEKVEARLDDAPDSVLRAEAVTAKRSGLSLRELHVEGAALTVDDLWKFRESIAAYQARRAQAGEPPKETLERVTFEGASLHATAIHGVAASFELTDAAGEIGSAPRLGDAHRVQIGAVNGRLGASAFGPWKLSSERTGAATKARLVLRDGSPAATITLDATADASRFDVAIPRARLGALGLPAAPLGLAQGDDPEIALTATAIDRPGASPAVEGNLDFHLYGFTIGFVPLPVELALGAAWRGDETAAAIDRATFSVGPFGGTARGTLRSLPALRLELGFESLPIPCDQFGRQAAGGLLALLGSAGGRGVAGEVKLTGSLVFDVAQPADNRLTLKPDADCSVTLFSPP